MTILNFMKMAGLIQKGRKNCGKRRNCSLRAISPFPTVFSKDLYCRHVKLGLVLERVNSDKQFYKCLSLIVFVLSLSLSLSLSLFCCNPVVSLTNLTRRSFCIVGYLLYFDYVIQFIQVPCVI